MACWPRPGAWRCDNHPVLGADLLHAFGNTPDLQGAACLANRDLFGRCTEPGASASYPQAIQTCLHECPVFAQCRAWAASCR